MHLTENDLKIMELAQRGPDGINIFWMYWSAPEGATQDQARMDLVGKSVDQYLPPLEYGQFVPMTVPAWAQEIAHGNESDTVIVGGVGSGKTLNMVMIAAFYCCMMPNFRFLGTAPLAWQADRSYKDLLSMVFDIDNVQGDPRRISRWVKQVRQRPYPTVEFVNGSSMEFKSVDGDARGILTWSGDMVVVDQAEDPSIDLSEMVGNLGSRIRGQVGGRARLGKLILMANSAYNPELWEMFDDYDADPKRRALLLTSWDNPYLTKRQLGDMEKRYRTKEEANQKMRSHRPLPKGKEFTQKVVEAAQSAELDSIMEAGLADELSGYDMQDSANAGVVRWVLPPVLGHDYILVGDPGQGNPPYRNSPPVMVFDITGFPNKPATLAYFNWVYGYGAYLPFINAMEYAYEMYHPVVAAFDATGMQKAFDELGVLDPNKIWEPLDLSSKKMHMVLCAKVLLAKSLILFPKSLYSVWNQLLMWQMPDTKLRQDIACCVFMVAYLLNSMLPMRLADDPEFEGIQSRLEQVDRWGRVRSINRRGTGRLHG